MASSKNWDSVAPQYEEKVFNVFESDRNQLLIKNIKSFSDTKKIAGDFGCGVGRALPLLSEYFDKVYAWDFSPESVKVAMEYGLRNVTCKTKDLSKSNVKLTQVDFGLCVNVAISDNEEINFAIVKNVIKSLKKGAYAIFVVPSWESVSMVSWRTLQLYEKEGLKVHEIPKEHLDFFTGSKVQPDKGIFSVAGIPTKHWLMTEFFSLFNKSSIRIETIEKIEYDWVTEFESPPSWVGYPYPWDWMVIVKKN